MPRPGSRDKKEAGTKGDRCARSREPDEDAAGFPLGEGGKKLVGWKGSDYVGTEDYI